MFRSLVEEEIISAGTTPHFSVVFLPFPFGETVAGELLGRAPDHIKRELCFFGDGLSGFAAAVILVHAIPRRVPVFYYGNRRVYQQDHRGASSLWRDRYTRLGVEAASRLLALFYRAVRYGVVRGLVFFLMIFMCSTNRVPGQEGNFLVAGTEDRAPLP